MRLEECDSEGKVDVHDPEFHLARKGTIHGIDEKVERKVYMGGEDRGNDQRHIAHANERNVTVVEENPNTDEQCHAPNDDKRRIGERDAIEAVGEVVVTTVLRRWYLHLVDKVGWKVSTEGHQRGKAWRLED